MRPRVPTPDRAALSDTSRRRQAMRINKAMSQVELAVRTGQLSREVAEEVKQALVRYPGDIMPGELFRMCVNRRFRRGFLK